MSAALRSELFRLVRRPMTRILLGLAAAIVAALYLLLWLSLEGAQDVVTAEGGVEELREMLTLAEVAAGGGASLVYLIAAVMAVILGASIIATEYSWGTVRTILPRTSGRATFLAGKAVVLLLFAAAVTLAGFAAAFAASGLITVLAGLNTALGDDFALRLGVSLLVIFVVVLPYMSLSFMAATLARSTAAGIGLGLAVFFLEGQIVMLLAAAGGAVETATEVLLTPNVSALLTLPAGEDIDAGAVWKGAAFVLGYAVAFFAIALWRFARRDVTLT